MKRCSRCKAEKPPTQFYKSKQTPDGRCSWCKPCFIKARRVYNLKAKFGITREEYNRMLAWSNGGCAICGAKTSRNRQELGVDHNHKTGEVRGLLCHRCNMGIGHFNDSLRLLTIAVAYLKYFGHTE